MTTARRQYNNPPVVEALAELYFDGSAWDMTVPGSFYERVKDRFPKKGQMDQLDFEVEVEQQGPNARVAPRESRAVFKSDDESRLVQVGRDVLVVNQLRPYPHFEAWSKTLLDMLEVYRELAQPKAVTRLGMRYVNRIDIPQQWIDMEQYFRIYAEVPAELGAFHGDFLVRLQLLSRTPGHEVLITLGKAPVEQPDVLRFVLDLYDLVPLDGASSFDVIKQRLNEAHENIEWVFEHAITDATRAIFGEVNR